MKKIMSNYLDLIIFLICLLFLILEINGLISAGKIYNYFFPCKQSLSDSAYCYVQIDIVATLVLLVLTIVSAGYIFTKFLVNKRKK